MKIRLSILVSVALVVLISGSAGAQAAQIDGTTTTKSFTASVIDSIDELAAKARTFLLAKQSALEKKIADLKLQEAAVAQTLTGQQINEATGGETVKATKPLGTPTHTLKRIGLQLYWLAVIVGLFILNHKIVLYLVLAYILYRLVRLLFGRFFTRRINV
jgi:hypothetical protein